MTDTPSNRTKQASYHPVRVWWDRGRPIAAALGMGLMLANCGGAAGPYNNTTAVEDSGAAAPAPDNTASEPVAITPTAAPSRSYSAAERSMICRAGIAKVMGRDPKTMKATDKGQGITAVQYRRPDDNKLWKSECKLEGNRIVWRGVDSFGNDGPGRWRDRPDDGTLTFDVKGKRITVTETYSDGSVVPETFTF